MTLWTRSENEDGYYVSITDMLTGLLFLFIVMLMYFATRLNDAAQTLISSEATRTQILEQIADYARDRGVHVEVDADVGVLRLPNEALFESNSASPNTAGTKALSVVADALGDILPCYAFARFSEPSTPCPPAFHHVDAIIIEGHTDSDSPNARSQYSDNWKLSSARAVNVYESLKAHRPDIAQIYNAPVESPDTQLLFGVAGYADQRPIARGVTSSEKARNRRIDFRIIMGEGAVDHVDTSPAITASSPAAATADQPKPRMDLESVGPVVRTPAANLPPLKLGQRLRFRPGGDGERYLWDGWSKIERWGVWSVGATAAFVLALPPDVATPLDLKVSGVAFVNETSPERSVQVEIDGKRVDEWKFVYPEREFERRVPLPADRRSTRLTIRFLILDPAAPNALGTSSDARALGIGLRELTIESSKSRP